MSQNRLTHKTGLLNKIIFKFNNNMTLIKKIQYFEKEILKEVSNLFESLDPESKLIIDDKVDLDDDLVIVTKKNAIDLLIETKEQNAEYAVIRIEFSKKQSGGDNDKFAMAKKYYLQIDKLNLTAQTILYHDYLFSDESVELVDNHNEGRLYEELNLLLESSIQGYLGVEENGWIEEGKDINNDQPF